jgi:hypothetical protein
MKQTDSTVVRDDGVAGSNPATPTSDRTISCITSSKVPTLFLALVLVAMFAGQVAAFKAGESFATIQCYLDEIKINLQERY